MTPRVSAGGVLASLWRLGLPTWAVEYRWPVVNLDALTVQAHIDHSGPAPHGEASQSHLEARLDHGGCSAAAALPGRPVQRLHEPGYGGQPPAWLQVWPRARDAAWTTRPWEGHPGDSVALVVSSEMRAWQEVEAVAANPEGVLRRLVIGHGGWFGRSRPEVHEVTDESLTNDVAQGTFTQWLEHNCRDNGLDTFAIGVCKPRGREAEPGDQRLFATASRSPCLRGVHTPEHTRMSPSCPVT
jgi:hypothetical protein